MALPTIRTALSTGPWRWRLRAAVRLVTPWGVEWWLHTRRSRRAQRAVEGERATAVSPPDGQVEQAIRYLTDRGLDEQAVRAGSMPEESLNYVADTVRNRLPVDRPVRALHIGNFVGVSLCFVSWLVTERHPGSVVVSVDPNVTHRGIENPNGHAVALLHHFGLRGMNLIVTGYTLEQSAGESWAATEAAYRSEVACEDVLGSLARLANNRFDFVLLDGNHEQGYLAREVAAIRDLVADDAIVVFDDITGWEGVVAVFKQALRDERFEPLGENGRVGILQMRTRS